MSNGKRRNNHTKVDQVYQTAYILAANQGSEFVTLEHLTIALLEDPTIQETLESMGVNALQIADEIESDLEAKVIRTNIEPTPTRAVTGVIQKAIYQAMASNNTTVE